MTKFQLKNKIIIYQLIIIFTIVGLLSFSYLLIKSTFQLPQNILQLEPEPHLTPSLSPTPTYNPCNGPPRQCINNKVYSCINGILTATGEACWTCYDNEPSRCILDTVHMCENGEWTMKIPSESCNGCGLEGSKKCENYYEYACSYGYWLPTGNYCEGCNQVGWGCQDYQRIWCNGSYWEKTDYRCVECENGDSYCDGLGQLKFCYNHLFQGMGSCVSCSSENQQRCNNGVSEICHGGYWLPTQSLCNSCTEDSIICVGGYHHNCINGTYQILSSQCCQDGIVTCYVGEYRKECINGLWSSVQPLALCINTNDGEVISLADIDYNNDNKIDSQELIYDLSHWGVCQSTNICEGDINFDSSVNEVDLNLVLSTW